MNVLRARCAAVAFAIKNRNLDHDDFLAFGRFRISLGNHHQGCRFAGCHQNVLCVSRLHDQFARFERNIPACAAVIFTLEHPFSEAPAIQEQFHLRLIGEGADLQFFARTAFPGKMQIRHPAANFVPAPGCKTDKRLICPERLALIIQRFRRSRQLQKTRLGNAHRPPFAFAQEVDARPEELTGNIIMIGHSIPAGCLMAVFRSENHTSRIFLMILLIEVFTIVVSGEIQFIGKPCLVGQFRERHGACHRACRIQ